MNTSTIVWIIAAVVVAGLAWFFLFAAPAPESTEAPLGAAVENTMPVPNTDTDEMVAAEEGGDEEMGGGIGDASEAPLTARVVYTADGFSPKEIIIKKGGTVTWVNEGSGSMWVATAQHPTHSVYAGTSLAEHCDDTSDISFDQCENGSTYSFTFDKVGTWNYHNHSSGGKFGTVMVVE